MHQAPIAKIIMTIFKHVSDTQTCNPKYMPLIETAILLYSVHSGHSNKIGCNSIWCHWWRNISTLHLILWFFSLTGFSLVCMHMLKEKCSVWGVLNIKRWRNRLPVVYIKTIFSSKTLFCFASAQMKRLTSFLSFCEMLYPVSRILHSAVWQTRRCGVVT